MFGSALVLMEIDIDHNTADNVIKPKTHPEDRIFVTILDP